MNAPRVLYHHRIRADDGQAVHVRLVSTSVERGFIYFVLAPDGQHHT